MMKGERKQHAWKYHKAREYSFIEYDPVFDENEATSPEMIPTKKSVKHKKENENI